MRRLSRDQVVFIHQRLIETSGGSPGIKDPGRLDAALAQPFATFDGNDLYPDLLSKAAALAFSLIQGHPFHDGNKRIGYAAMVVFLKLNGYQISSDVDDAEQTVLSVASGSRSRDAFESWVRSRVSTIGA